MQAAYAVSRLLVAILAVAVRFLRAIGSKCLTQCEHPFTLNQPIGAPRLLQVGLMYSMETYQLSSATVSSLKLPSGQASQPYTADVALHIVSADRSPSKGEDYLRSGFCGVRGHHLAWALFRYRHRQVHHALPRLDTGLFDDVENPVLLLVVDQLGDEVRANYFNRRIADMRLYLGRPGRPRQTSTPTYL